MEWCKSEENGWKTVSVVPFYFFAVQTDDTKLVILAFNLIAEKTCTLRFLFCRCFRSCFKRFFREKKKSLARLVLLPFSLFVTGLEPFGTKRFGEDASVFWPKDPNTNAICYCPPWSLTNLTPEKEPSQKGQVTTSKYPFFRNYMWIFRM